MQVCKLNNPGTLTYFDNDEKFPDNYESDDSYVDRNKSKRIKLMNDLPKTHVVKDTIDASTKGVSPHINNPNDSQIKAKDTSNLVAVSRLPQKYRSVFSKFEYFNDVQSEVYEDVMETSDPIVISAPTGCGKTALFELAIICHLMKRMANSKMVYIAPIKALCSERYSDWMSKFSDHQLRILELTGDTGNDNKLNLIRNHELIVTTPEKFDSVTRWCCMSDPSLMQTFKLIMIDEVHMLNDEDRGHVLEAVVSRLKTAGNQPRFIAASATFPNVEDVALWLGGAECVFFKFDEEVRPVQLNRIVLGYPMFENQSEFKFEMNLSYKLPEIINQYSCGAPSLVFCNSRSSTANTASILSKQMKFSLEAEKQQLLNIMARGLTDSKLRDLVLDHHIGFHHAGLTSEDKKTIEQLFSSGLLPVLTCTSTLALGVNLPAQLVVIKSTQQIVTGGWREYSESQVLQMAGRAGRPQFCSSATVVIMTEAKNKHKYEELMVGSSKVESSLHKHLNEHLNAEIIAGTISNSEQALDWVKSTYLYMRVNKNPSFYQLDDDPSIVNTDDQILKICKSALSSMHKIGLVLLSKNGSVGGTGLGRLMSRHYLAFSTMELLTGDMEAASVSQLLELVCKSREMSDVVLRTSERNTLNRLNRNRERKIVKYQLPGKIKNKEMKVNILIQAILGCMQIPDISLNMEAPRLLWLASRIATCLVEVVIHDPKKIKDLTLVKNSLLLAKSLGCGIWADSEMVCKQVDKVGLVLSRLVAEGGYKDVISIAQADPRMLELAARKTPPFGNKLRDWAAKLPRYKIRVEMIDVTRTFVNARVIVSLENKDLVSSSSEPGQHKWVLVVGAGNTAVGVTRGTDALLIQSDFSKSISMSRKEEGKEKIEVSLISLLIAGVDKVVTVDIENPKSNEEETKSSETMTKSSFMSKFRRECNHSCSDKLACRHECCKTAAFSCNSKKTSTNKASVLSGSKGNQSGSNINVSAATESSKVLTSMDNSYVSNVPERKRDSSSSSSSHVLGSSSRSNLLSSSGSKLHSQNKRKPKEDIVENIKKMTFTFKSTKTKNNTTLFK